MMAVSLINDGPVTIISKALTYPQRKTWTISGAEGLRG